MVIEIGHERPHFEAAFPRLPAVWLETSAGDNAVLLVTREALVRFLTSELGTDDVAQRVPARGRAHRARPGPGR